MCKTEDFIFEKENSITPELCDDIIFIFDNDISIKRIEYEGTNDLIIYNFQHDLLYNRITNFLNMELKRNCNIYNLQIKNNNLITRDNNNNKKYNLLPPLKNNILTIKKINYSNHSVIEQQSKMISYNITKKLHFIFFLILV
jgi:hypothetical protein